MRGRTTAVPSIFITELIQLATENDSVTPAEITKILDTPQVLVDYELTWSVESGE